jgi:uncharacterized membrane protein
MPTITLYSKPNCPLCDHARHYLEQVLAEQPDPAAWEVDEISILDDQDLYALYRYVIPVVVVGEGKPILAPESMDPARLRQALGTAPLRPATTAPSAVGSARAALPTPDAATERDPDQVIPASASPAPPPPPAPVAPYPYYYGGAPPKGVLGALDRLGNGLGKHWLAAANTLVGIFSTLPWLAPIFARLGWWAIADPIYTTYMFFCHQLPERAGFLFGYQVAYCYRNSAIYTTIVLTGLLYALARRQGPAGPLAGLLRPLRWQIFLLLILPMAVDGMSHLLGLRETNAWFDTLTGGRFGDFSVGDSLGTLNWWLRIISGALFGFAVVRLVFPWVQVAFDESRRMVWLAPPPVRPPAAMRPAAPTP